MIGYQDWSGFAFLAPAVPGAAARSGNYEGAAVDALNAEGPIGLLLTGTATATAEITVEESDTGTGSWTDVPEIASGLTVNNQLPVAVPISATETVYKANFNRSKRYIRCVITGTGHSLAGVFIGRSKYLGS